MLAALLLAATACIPLPTCTDNGDVRPCATPTPVVSWDQVADADLAGYSIYWRDTGSGWFNVLAQIACRWDDDDEDPLTPLVRFCLGADFPIPLQRWCPQCAPYQSYEFAVKSYDDAGNWSADYSNIVEVCFSPICVAPGPCS
jgi:hypothetical protein